MKTVRMVEDYFKVYSNLNDSFLGDNEYLYTEPSDNAKTRVVMETSEYYLTAKGLAKRLKISLLTVRNFLVVEYWLWNNVDKLVKSGKDSYKSWATYNKHLSVITTNGKVRVYYPLEISKAMDTVGYLPLYKIQGV